ncbi:hypothetical protein EON63_16495 [archaeon]|nr:MAG: hypothetical protein EON63_16495 [archaeon]
MHLRTHIYTNTPYVQSSGPFFWPPWLIRKVMEGAGRGLVYLHRHNPPIIHRGIHTHTLTNTHIFPYTHTLAHAHAHTHTHSHSHTHHTHARPQVSEHPA